MIKFRLFLESVILFFLVSIFTPVAHGEYKDASKDFLNAIQQNRVVLTCYDSNDNLWGGQGTITNVDQTGTWIITAGHVSHDSKYCEAMFRDGSTHIAHISKEFEHSDVTILFASRASWPTHASLAPLKIGEHIYDFGEVELNWKRNEAGSVLGVMFDFSNTLYDGKALSKMPAPIMHYPVHKGSIVLTNLWSQPGSSGGGVFDDNGNLVGLVTGGSVINPYVTYIVDLNESMEEEAKREVTNVQNNSH